MAELDPGATFGEFRIEALVGRGGMGLVYRARQERLGRPVALKIIAPHLAADEGFRARFRREAQMAAAIDHPNILPIYDAGEIDGQPYLALRYVDGTDLYTLIGEQSPLEPARVLAIGEQVAHALDAAHARGLIHRDVKPANILLDRAVSGREVAYLTDFGLTRAGTDTRLTKTGGWVGTVDYMAPEQFEAGAVSGGADQYSLACVLFEALTGTRPFPRESDLQVMFAHVRDDRPVATERRPTLPPACDAVLQRGMARSAGERFSSCGDLVTALRTAVGSAPSAQTTPVAAGQSPVTLVGDETPDSGGALTPAGTVVGTQTDGPVPVSGRRRSDRRNRLVALAAGGALAAGIATAVALSGNGEEGTASVSSTIQTTTTTTPQTVTTTASDPDGFPPATALELVAVAAKPATGVIVYSSNTPSLRGKIRVATAGKRIGLMVTDTKLEMRLYAIDEEIQWVCAKDRAVGRSVCRKARNLTGAERAQLQATLTSYMSLMSDDGIKKYFGPLALLGPEIFSDRQMEREVACLQRRQNGDMARLCTTRDGFVTELTAVTDGERISLTGTSLRRGTPTSDFVPTAKLQ